jgi:hypothetical protein
MSLWTAHSNKKYFSLHLPAFFFLLPLPLATCAAREDVAQAMRRPRGCRAAICAAHATAAAAIRAAREESLQLSMSIWTGEGASGGCRRKRRWRQEQASAGTSIGNGVAGQASPSGVKKKMRAARATKKVRLVSWEDEDFLFLYGPHLMG